MHYQKSACLFPYLWRTICCSRVVQTVPESWAPFIPARLLLLDKIIRNSKPCSHRHFLLVIAVVFDVTVRELPQRILGIPVRSVRVPTAGFDLGFVQTPVRQLFLKRRSTHVHRNVQFSGSVIVQNHLEHTWMTIEKIFPGNGVIIWISTPVFRKPWKSCIRYSFQSCFICFEFPATNVYTYPVFISATNRRQFVIMNNWRFGSKNGFTKMSIHRKLLLQK